MMRHPTAIAHLAFAFSLLHAASAVAQQAPGAADAAKDKPAAPNAPDAADAAKDKPAVPPVAGPGGANGPAGTPPIAAEPAAGAAATATPAGAAQPSDPSASPTAPATTPAPAAPAATANATASADATGADADADADANIEAPLPAAPAAEDYQLDMRLSLDPTAPYVGALPGGVTPAFGEKPVGSGDWRFDFHGMIIAPMRAGINSRRDPSSDKRETVLHSPPVVPDDRETFSHTGVVLNPYVQMNFSYGNSVVTGNVTVLANQASSSVGFFDPAAQPGIYDAFIDIHPDFGKRVKFRAFVGAFTRRYGSMGEYDLGRYGTPLIARVNGMGESISATIGVSKDFSILIEQGIQGLSNKAPVDIYPDGWNDFADSSVGTSFAHHYHLAASYRGMATLGGHYIHALSRDERGSGTLGGDGNIHILGADLRLNLGRFGHFMAAFQQTTAENASTVGRVVEIMNTRGGPGLAANYFGDHSGGTGKLVLFGGQYDLSIGKLVSYPTPFTADGPDIVVSLFGISGKVTESNDKRYEGLAMNKFGGEVTYGMLSWLAASARYDRVVPDTAYDQRTFAVVSPRLIFHTDWSSTDQIVLQYSHWFNGSLVTVRDGYPPREDPRIIPDEDMVLLSANMWW